MEPIYIEGKIIEILPESRGTSQKGEWVNQEFVLKTEETYPRNICFSVWGEDKIKEADIHIGDIVSIGINIDSRKSAYGKYFTSIKAWNVKKKRTAYQSQAAPTPQPTPPVSQPVQSNPPKKKDDVDDLPF